MQRWGDASRVLHKSFNSKGRSSAAYPYGIVKQYSCILERLYAREAASAIEERLCELLPALMLARVDGKSPVEYLSAEDQSFVRNSAIRMLHDTPNTLHEFVRIILSALQKERQ